MMTVRKACIRSSARQLIFDISFLFYFGSKSVSESKHYDGPLLMAEFSKDKIGKYLKLKI